jgi:hypothetical protein
MAASRVGAQLGVSEQEVEGRARRVRALKTPSAYERRSWFCNRSSDVRAKAADEKLSRALDDFGRMADAIKTTLDFLQFGAAQRATTGGRTTPTPIRTSDGDLRPSCACRRRLWANTALPGRGGWIGFAVMACLMIFTGTVTYLVFALSRLRNDSSP